VIKIKLAPGDDIYGWQEGHLKIKEPRKFDPISYDGLKVPRTL
jgi:hypothetical protein